MFLRKLYNIQVTLTQKNREGVLISNKYLFVTQS